MPAVKINKVKLSIVTIRVQLVLQVVPLTHTHTGEQSAHLNKESRESREEREHGTE